MAMKKYTLILLIIVLLVPAVAVAQKRKKNSHKAKSKPKVEEVEVDPRLQMMLEATQQVVFIDSIVVPKNDFIKHIPLSTECGRLGMTDGLGMHTNELADKRYEAIAGPQKTTHLYTRDMMGYSWGDPVRLKGLTADDANYPYVMPDGTTLYFAQKGENAIGGYDIFVTRFDNESGTFLKPENLGMPFASEANDYLYAIDENYQLGYFVTDRRQPSGKVCIYVFIPNETRRTYNSEAYSEEQLHSLAAINRIADTWGKGNTRKQAIQRFEEARRNFALNNASPQDKGINQSHLDKMRLQAEVLAKALQLARNNYAQATNSQRMKLRGEILKSEQELEDLQRKIKQEEKNERNKQYQ